MNGGPSSSSYADETAAGPLGAIRAWWRAVQDGGLPRLAALLDPEYVVVFTGVPAGRIVGRAQVLDQPADFFGDGAVKEWDIADLHVAVDNHVAICSYQWTESARHSGANLDMRGWATDVLQRQGDDWIHRARHVGTMP